jgi:spore coat protein U-like protein
MRFYSKIALCAVAAWGAAIPATVQAATATTTMTINANVVSGCTVAAAPMSFGNYSGAVLSTTTTISPNCTNGTPFTIQIDVGAGSGATTAVRKLTNGASQTLNYSIYTSNTYATAWGSNIGTDTVAGTGTGATQTVNVYGRIPAGQTSTVGTGYTDTVNITLNF